MGKENNFWNLFIPVILRDGYWPLSAVRGGAVVVLDLDSSVRASEGDSALYSLTPSISESPCNLKS